MAAILARSPMEVSSANSQNNPLALLQQIVQPQTGSSGMDQADLQALTNYFKQGTQAAGNPSSQPPNGGSMLMGGLSNSLDNSQAGQMVNGAAGNPPSNGYLSQLMQGLFGGGTTATGAGVAGTGAAADASQGDGLASLMSLFA